jgi:hypothetical protein
VLNIAPEQRLECPAEFAERITAAGGVNKYDKPNFRLVWGQSPAAMIRAGGSWDFPHLEGVEHYRGYRDIPVDGYEACWLLQQWMPAEFWGSPAAWYIQNWDNDTEMQVLGGYPYSGRYLTIFSLIYRDKENGIEEHMPLNNFLVDVVVPIVVMSRQISDLKKRAVVAEQKARRDAEEVAQIEASIRNATPALGEIRSAAGLSCLSEVQKKMDAIERYWQSGCDFIRQRGKGLSVA